MRILVMILFLAGAVGLSPVLRAAGDAEANELVVRALAESKDGDYRDAAKLYDEASLMADSTQLKFNALQEAAAAYGKAGLLAKEFETLETMLNRYSSKCDFVKVTDREFEIANAYDKGHRDPAYWALRWIPWLTEPDRTTEFYQKALERAPFAKAAPAARLALAFRLDQELKPDEAINQLRTLIKDYPTAPERKYAYLSLGEMLYQRSRRGDGDGKYNREALATFREFKNLYPDAPENDFVDKCILKAKDVQAERLLNIAKFYKRTGRTETAERYLNTVMQYYPDSKSAEASERMLVSLDKTYTPDDYRPEVIPREQIYLKQQLPEEASALLIVPEDSDRKYLLPVYDIKNKDAAEVKKAEQK